MRAIEFLVEAELDPEGWGQTPFGTDIDYFGLRVQMKPSTFLKLSLPLGDAESNPEVEKHMKAGGKIAYPMLFVDIPETWSDGDYSKPAKVTGHEGRNRMTAWIKIKGDDPVQVNIKPNGWYRRKHLTPEIIEALSKGLIGQRGNLIQNSFDANSALEETVSSAGGQHKWMGNEPYRHLVEKDIEEDLSRRGFLGGLAGMAMAAAATDAEAGQKKIKPKIKSPSPELVKQAKKQQVSRPASPSMNPQAEALLYKTAKASGMKGAELAQFLAQTKHESWNHSRLQEKPIGDPERYFTKKYDPTLAPKTAKILGNKVKGDGAKYHGRGFIQLTGRDNYRMAGEALGIDLLSRPELASKPDVAAKIAVWYWDTRVRPKVKDFEDTVAVTKTINNAMFGLEDRLANFIDYKKRVA